MCSGRTSYAPPLLHPSCCFLLVDFLAFLFERVKTYVTDGLGEGGGVGLACLALDREKVTQPKQNMAVLQEIETLSGFVIRFLLSPPFVFRNN